MMELKVFEIQKSLINQQMLPKRERAKKKVIDKEIEILFSDILHRELSNINKI